MSPAYLKPAQNTYISLQSGKFTYHKAISEWNAEYLMYFIEHCTESDKQHPVCWLFTLVIVWLTGSCRCPASWDSAACFPSFGRPGKDQNSQFKVHFPPNAYYFRTILTLQNREVEPSLSQTPCAYSKVLQPVTKLSLNWVSSKTLANLLV